MTWSQVYAPVGGIGTSALIAALPVVVLLGLLAFWHVRAHIAALIALAIAMGVAVLVFGMPLSMASTNFSGAMSGRPHGPYTVKKRNSVVGIDHRCA